MLQHLVWNSMRPASNQALAATRRSRLKCSAKGTNLGAMIG
jgi:hypothetical protein